LSKREGEKEKVIPTKPKNIDHIHHPIMERPPLR
jgi:hypothetical protein